MYKKIKEDLILNCDGIALEASLELLDNVMNNKPKSEQRLKVELEEFIARQLQGGSNEVN